MNKEKLQKYIVSGNSHKKFSFSSLDFIINPIENQIIERISNEKYCVNDEVESEFIGTILNKKQNQYTVELNGNTYQFTIDREETFLRKEARAGIEGISQPYNLKSPMPGKVCEVLVAPGDFVKKGEPILILEAMKMQNQLLASDDAQIKIINVKVNQNVFGDQILVELERLN